MPVVVTYPADVATSVEVSNGITIREHIAIKMMAALTASNYGGSMSEHALLACQQADALLAELAKEIK